MKKLPWHENIKHERLLHNWTQAQLAEKIDKDLKTIQRWENGYPLPRLTNQQLLANIFGTTIDALNFPRERAEAASQVSEQQDKIASSEQSWLWDTPHVEQFYGRHEEVDKAERWLHDHSCRVLALLGIGGVGKTTLAAVLRQRVEPEFQHIMWISLCDAPLPTEMLARCLTQLSTCHIGSDESSLTRGVSSYEERFTLLLTHFRAHRCLLVLDNFESLFQEGSAQKQYREGYEQYGTFLQQLGEVQHRSCLLLTSREMPGELTLLQHTPAVRVLHIIGVDYDAGCKILKAEEIQGTDRAQAELIKQYGGNPLALKLIADPIRTFFDGDIAAFLRDGELVVDSIRALLDRQFQRLSEREQEMMYWLAIEREPVELPALRANIVHHVPANAIVDALTSLGHRSLIEHNPSVRTRCTLQPVIMEYITERLIALICDEIEQEKFYYLARFALMKAQARDYIRRNQLYFIVEPILACLLTHYDEEGLERHLKKLVAMLHHSPQHQRGYAAGNLLNLLIALRADLRDSDFSSLVIRQAYIQGVELPGANFSASDLSSSVFSETFSSIACVTLSPDGTLLAAGTNRGELRIWQAENAVLLFTCPGHCDWVRSIAFSDDGRLLVSGSEDMMVRLWDSHTGQCLKVLTGHSTVVDAVAFSPHCRLIASGSEDKTVRLWDAASGQHLSTLPGHTAPIRCVAFSPDGRLLASGGEDQEIRLWDISGDEARCIKVLPDSRFARSLAFNPTNTLLASGDDDGIVHIWSLSAMTVHATLKEHGKAVRSVIFSADGHTLASGSQDKVIRLWETRTWSCVRVLYGHTGRVRSVAFGVRGEMVVSASTDQTVRFWDVRTGNCLKILQGYTNLIKALAFSPNGALLASGSDDHCVRLWDVRSGGCLRVLRGHTDRVRSLAFSPDSNALVSGGEDEMVCIWQVHNGQSLKMLRDHVQLVRSVAFSSDGRTIASGSYDHTVRLWDTRSRACRHVLHKHSDVIWEVAFHPGGSTLASCSKDRAIFLWDAQSGAPLQQWTGQPQRVRAIFISPTNNVITAGSENEVVYLWDSQHIDVYKELHGHTHQVRALAFSQDGTLIASGSHDQSVRIWDVHSGTCLSILEGQGDGIRSVAFSPDGSLVAGGSGDGLICLWDRRTGERIALLRSERPYEGMNITGAKGLNEAQHASLVVLGAIEYEVQL